jgi:hypothetical protein
VSTFIQDGYKSMSSGAMKSSHQSDIGALCRRSKLGAERIFLHSTGVLLGVQHDCATPLYTMNMSIPGLGKSGHNKIVFKTRF